MSLNRQGRSRSHNHVRLCWDLSLCPRELDSIYVQARNERLLLSERLHCQLNAAVILVIGLHLRRQLHSPVLLDVCTGLCFCSHVMLWLLTYHKAKYLATRRFTVPVLRTLLVLYGTVSLVVRSRALKWYSGAFFDPGLIILLSTAGFSHSFNKPLDMRGLPLPFGHEIIAALAFSFVDLFSEATVNHITSISRGHLFEVTQRLHGRLDLGMQFVTSLLSSASPFIEPYSWKECHPCGALVLLIFTHMFTSGVMLYLRYITEWKDRLRFLRNATHPLLTRQAVRGASEDLCTQLLVDQAQGFWRSVLAHTALVFSIIIFSWSASNVLVSDVLPVVLPHGTFDAVCPLASLGQ